MDPKDYEIWKALKEDDEDEAFERDVEKYGEDGAMERLALRQIRKENRKKRTV